MATGHPDFQTQAGRAVGGANITGISFTGSVNAESSSSFDLASVPSGERHSIINISISCADDSSINKIQLIRVSDLVVLYINRFVASLHIDVNLVDLTASQQLRVTITNNSLASLTFVGSIYFVVKEI